MEPGNMLPCTNVASVPSRYTGPRTMNPLQIVGTDEMVPTLDVDTFPPVYES